MKAQEDYDLTDFLQKEAEADQRKRDAFAMLLGQHREKAGRIFALRTNMGGDSYIASLPLSWVINHVMLASDCPLFEEHDKVKTIAANENQENLRQQIDWRRQATMAAYLLENENHKFPPLLVTAYQNWTRKTPLESDIWGPDGRAMRPSVYAYSLDSNDCFLDVIDEDTRYFALDGQHRLLALRGLKTLLDYGKLPALDQAGNRKRKGEVVLDTIIESILVREGNADNSPASKAKVRERLRGRLSQTIGVEVIPAVQMWETREEATARLRQLLADLH